VDFPEECRTALMALLMLGDSFTWEQSKPLLTYDTCGFIRLGNLLANELVVSVTTWEGQHWEVTQKGKGFLCSDLPASTCSEKLNT